MISKTVKTSLFALLVLSIAVPTTAMVYAKESPSAEQIDDALTKVSPYVEIDAKKIGHLDISSAKKNGISDSDLKIASQILKAQNNMIKRIHENPNERMYVDAADREGLEEYRKSIQEGKKGNTDVELLGIQYAYAADVCGGSSSNPHTEPTVVTTGSYVSKAAAIADLPGTFHEVPQYASYNYGNDYHDPRTLYNCTTDSFRYQTIVQDTGSDWEYSQQHSPDEPNPEILAYTHPVWWWSFYVVEWHINN